jgi:hypothetical protein
MDGSEKMPLVVTENQETKLLQACEVPAMYYRHNSTMWITWALYMELLTCLERRMAAQNQEMFLDQCAPLLA